MSNKGHFPKKIFAGIPVNMPILLGQPSTSTSTSGAQNQQTEQTSKTLPAKEPSKTKLPLFGPLDIHDLGNFLKEQEVLFRQRYNRPCTTKINNIDEYKYQYIAGRGDFSRVVVAKKDSQLYALKIYHKRSLVEKHMVDQILEERHILQSLDCPFCIRLENFYQNPSELFFILPFLSGGKLFTEIQKQGRLDEHTSKFYAAQIVLGLEYLHCCNLLYRELKPEGLLLDHFGYLRLADFRSAKIDTSGTFSICGSPEYVAPEMIAGRGYGKSVDWWAFGIVLFEMNTGHPPFMSHDKAVTYRRISAAQYTPPNTFSKALQDLISKLLRPNVSKRVGSKTGAEDIKKHEWFKEIDWMKMLNRKEDPPYVPTEFRESMGYPALTHTWFEDNPDTTSNVEEYFKEF